MAEKATAPEAEQTPTPTPDETPEAAPKEEVKEEAQPTGEAGATKDDGAGRLTELESQLQELQQGRSAEQAQHKVTLERLRVEAGQEADRRAGQAAAQAKADLAAERRQIDIVQLKKQISEGDEDAIGKLAQLAAEPHEQAQKAEETARIRSEAQTSGWIEGYATSMNRRLERTEPTDGRRTELTTLWNAGKFEELETEMAKDEATKVTGASDERLAALEKQIADLTKTNTEASEEEAAQKVREDGGADLGGGTPGGRSDTELLMDQNTPIDQIREIRTRQKTGG